MSTASCHPNFTSSNLYPGTFLPTLTLVSALGTVDMETAPNMVSQLSSPTHNPSGRLTPESIGMAESFGSRVSSLLPGVSSGLLRPQAPIISGPLKQMEHYKYKIRYRALVRVCSRKSPSSLNLSLQYTHFCPSLCSDHTRRSLMAPVWW